MPAPTQARLAPTSPRYLDWQRVFRSDVVELDAPMPERALLPRRGACDIYKLKLAALTADQQARLVDHLCLSFNLPIDEVVTDLRTHGCPILADDVTLVAGSN